MAKVVIVIGIVVLFAGCGQTGTKTEFKEDIATIALGNYPPPPPDWQPKKLAVMPFKDKTDKSLFAKWWQHWDFNAGAVASDQMITLLSQSGRFSLFERERLEEILKEQHLDVDPTERAIVGKLKGVDYLLFGSVTNFRIEVIKRVTAWGIALKLLADVDAKELVMKVDIGIDARIVDATTGEIVASHFAEFAREDTAYSFGFAGPLRIFSYEGKSTISIDKDSAGKLMRFAVDHWVKQALPTIDTKLAAAKKIKTCPWCNSAVSEKAKFCPRCGKTLEPSCTKCGKKFEVEVPKFCDNCGHQLKQE